MARISATPNPVGVYSANVGALVTIDWDTELIAVNGTLKVLRNGTAEEQVSGQSTGTSGIASFIAKTPHTYTVVLLRNQIELESVLVTTFDLRQQLAAGFAQAYAPLFRPQMITNLVVKPGVDTVRISFRTTLPTIPTTELRLDTGAWVDGNMPLFGGLRTRHEVVFGLGTALAVNRTHSFKIEAFGPTNNPGSPNKAVVDGEFITGTRNVDVMYETLDVHDDGDSSGAGEFRVKFMVGDVATGARLGTHAFLSGNISDKDPPIDLGKTLSLTDVHRQLWLQVLAHENDHEIGILHLMRDHYNGPGGTYSDDGVEEIVRLTIHVDVDTNPGRSMIPFELRTGDWPVDFVVTGHLGVHAFEGSFISTKIGKLAPPSQSSAFLTEPGRIARLAVGGVGERTEDVALGGDGAFYHRSLRRERAKTGGGSDWTRVELPGRGTPVVAAVGDMLELIDLDQRGGVIHSRFDPSKPKGAKWRRLGGDFAHIVPAVERGKGRGAEAGLILFGIADDGDLFARDARDDEGDWVRLGDRPVRAVAPVSAIGTKTALLAVSDNGALLHFSRGKGRWRADTLSDRVPGETPTQLLTAVVIDQIDGNNTKSRHRDLIIGAMSEDRRVRTLRWPDYPAGAPDGRWEELGTVQDLLLAEQPSSRKRRRKVSKS